MSDSSPETVVRRFYDEVFNGGRFAAVDELLAEDFVNHDQEGTAHSAGRAGVRAMFQALRTAFPDLNYQTDDLFVAGDLVVDRGFSSGTHNGPLFSIPPSGRRFTMKEMHINRVRDGQMVEHWGVSDSLKMRQDLGLGLSQPAPTGGATPLA
ncbi:MAG: ester cyclase [Dehalococcoidia bacterium]